MKKKNNPVRKNLYAESRILMDFFSTTYSNIEVKKRIRTFTLCTRQNIQY